MSWITTYSGHKAYPLDLKPDQIDIIDIAHALGNICRFTGHCREFYSVAQHSVLVSQLCDPEFALQGLLHDATEAYFADIAHPVKRAIGDTIDPIETSIWIAIANKFDVPEQMHDSVHTADRRILKTEARELMGEGYKLWDMKAEPYDISIRGQGPETAKTKFLARFKELT